MIRGALIFAAPGTYESVTRVTIPDFYNVVRATCGYSYEPSVVRCARETLLAFVGKVTACGRKVIYADTDTIFISGIVPIDEVSAMIGEFGLSFESVVLDTVLILGKKRYIVVSGSHVKTCGLRVD